MIIQFSSMIQKTKIRFYFYLFVISSYCILTYSCFYEVEELYISDENLIPVLNISVSKTNPRNSEGDFIKLKNGGILFIYSHFYGEDSGDFSSAYLASRYSDDEGKSWTSNDEIVNENEGIHNIMSVSLLRLENGDIALFYSVKNSIDECFPVMRLSKDEAKTWSNPITIINDKEGYFVLNNDRVIQLANGRILVPVSRHNIANGTWKEYGEIFCYYSDDNGNSWLSSTQVPNNNGIVLQEPGLIELRDGSTMMYMRSNVGYQQLSYSFDNGQSWDSLITSNIKSPLSPALIKKIPNSGNWLLVWNNTYNASTFYGGSRSPLTVAISNNEGNSWYNIKDILEHSGGLDYPSVHFVDKKRFLLSIKTGNECRIYSYKLDE